MLMSLMTLSNSSASCCFAATVFGQTITLGANANKKFITQSIESCKVATAISNSSATVLIELLLPAYLRQRPWHIYILLKLLLHRDISE